MLEMCNISLNSLLTKNKEYVVFELRRLFLEVLGIVLNDMWCHKQKPSGCRFCEPLTNPCAVFTRSCATEVGQIGEPTIREIGHGTLATD
ncbi:uncharacterized protein LOC110898157 isoform X2 [Helianthus annuus]|uniref:uncharacterized protein LOC110898157 isoform X2 n=1 Tax=Helianthus annuus TaxID=4232 RepID=UPI000B900939|nr:uncharacterized protein LOC110898157 isoform X2 [Helianthus annuus]